MADAKRSGGYDIWFYAGIVQACASVVAFIFGGTQLGFAILACGVVSALGRLFVNQIAEHACEYRDKTTTPALAVVGILSVMFLCISYGGLVVVLIVSKPFIASFGQYLPINTLQLIEVYWYDALIVLSLAGMFALLLGSRGMYKDEVFQLKARKSSG
jgi:hypothetical protein